MAWAYSLTRTYKIIGHSSGDPTVVVTFDGTEVVNTSLTSNLSTIGTANEVDTPFIDLFSWQHTYPDSEKNSLKAHAVTVSVTGGDLVWGGEMNDRDPAASSDPTDFRYTLNYTDDANKVGCKSNLIIAGEAITIDRSQTGNMPFTMRDGETAQFTMHAPGVNAGDKTP